MTIKLKKGSDLLLFLCKLTSVVACFVSAFFGYLQLCQFCQVGELILVFKVEAIFLHVSEILKYHAGVRYRVRFGAKLPLLLTMKKKPF